MRFKVINFLNLFWRIAGCDVIILVMGALNLSTNPEIFTSIMHVNLFYVLIVSYQLIKKKSTFNSDVFEVAIIYIATRVATIFCAKGLMDNMLLIVTMIIEGLWITKFYVLAKRDAVKKR